MELTEEQQRIVRSTGNIKINAVAGLGKTTTVIEYAKARPKSSEILYLAFNKSVKLEAARRFRERGLRNVRVETAHSLAYRHVVRLSHYRVSAQGYQTHEIAELLGLQGNGEKHAEYVIATHINRFVAYFCNSDARKVQDLNYLDTVSDQKARTFVTTFYDYIEAQTQRLLDRMERGEIDITHDFYLKKFQLSNPVLSYDYILFDEGQDASPDMLDIFLRQRATKVIVGDTHQQIYGWRHAVNSLEKADFKIFHLSTVHRCKGMEYDAVQLVNDFITEERLEEMKVTGQMKDQNPAKLNEEINLLYVAITRAKTRLHIPEALVPIGFPISSQIKIIQKPAVEQEKAEEPLPGFTRKERSKKKPAILPEK